MTFPVKTLAAASILVTACANQAINDVRSPHFVLPTSSILTLNETIEIPPHSLSVSIQNGSVYPSGAVNAYAPNCSLRVRHLKDTGQTVEPGTFDIVAVSRQVDIIPIGDIGGAQLAGPAITLASGGADDGPSDELYKTLMTLRSSTPSQVSKVVCQQLDDPGLGQHVTFEEMQITLRPVADLELPVQSPIRGN